MEGDKLKLHLSIDEEQKESEAYAYSFATPYAASGNTGFYFMPQKGDRVKLYFPMREEGNAYVMNEIRLDGEDNPFTEDPVDNYNCYVLICEAYLGWGSIRIHVFDID